MDYSKESPWMATPLDKEHSDSRTKNVFIVIEYSVLQFHPKQNR
jgi:hypothetical protein